MPWRPLNDGTPVSIRAIRKDDKESIHNAFKALDREAVYRRFFAPKQDLTDLELEQVIDVDFSQVVALVATVFRADGEEIVIGDGRYVADQREKPERAELGFLVAEPYRGRGIATLLLRHLAPIAQDAGLSAFEADVLNTPMLAVFRHSGLPICRRREGNIIHVTLSLSSAQGPKPSSSTLSGPSSATSVKRRNLDTDDLSADSLSIVARSCWQPSAHG
jgi:GNAT superfamily N-acetyltransferase